MLPISRVTSAVGVGMTHLRTFEIGDQVKPFLLESNVSVFHCLRQSYNRHITIVYDLIRSQ